ncbi:MAG TPA: hypothetical protein VM032_17820 [Vicinamibacterales bacterium]|nr:hypothetical protein [Vicinamibacterales bacterium]
MTQFRVAVAALAAVISVGSWVMVGTGQQPAAPTGVSGPPPAGLSQGLQVFPAIEGWGPLKDGRNAIEVGYFNRNKDQVIDVPIGPNNRIEPGGPDLGQPTHFEPGRHYGVFAIPVPKDFGTRKYTWTLVSNGQTTQIQLGTVGPYWIDFYKNAAKGNTPPVIKFTESGTEFSGPPVGTALTLDATVGQALPLTLWAKDRPDTYDPEADLPPDQRTRDRDNAAAARARAGRGGPTNFDISAATGSGAPAGRGFGRGAGPQPDITVTWKVHRGAASNVKFASDVVRLTNDGDFEKYVEARNTATFTAAGDYVLRAQVNDKSGDGGGGEQCCWTNALVKVTVK